MRVVTVLILLAATLAAASTLSPKQRVEREFRQLETALARCMYEEVLTSPEIEFMNRALHDFMRDNPGVTRVLRANAGGFTVNDISATSPLSAPPRNVGSQRWFQHIAQSKTPYYSMDIDAEGQIILFYAWPLSANTDKDAFTGAFAAYIDFTSQVALIDDAPPFRIVYQGRPVFEHDWDDIDYAEEPLAIKGARDLAIRTLKPFPTRLDPRMPQSYKSSASSFGGPLSERLGYGPTSSPYSDYEDEEEDEAAAGTKQKSATGWDAYGGLMSKIIFALLVIIAIMLAYSIFGNKGGGGRSDARTATGSMPTVPETHSQPIVLSMAGLAGLAQVAAASAGVAGADQSEGDLVDKAELTELTDKIEKIDKADKDQEAMMAKMLSLIREEFNMMENKIDLLSRRIDDMEIRQL